MCLPNTVTVTTVYTIPALLEAVIVYSPSSWYPSNHIVRVLLSSLKLYIADGVIVWSLNAQWMVEDGLSLSMDTLRLIDVFTNPAMLAE